MFILWLPWTGSEARGTHGHHPSQKSNTRPYDTHIADATQVSHSEFLHTKLKPGDIVCFLCTPEGVVSLRHTRYLKIHRSLNCKGIFDLSRLDAPGRKHRRLFELVPSPKSTLVKVASQGCSKPLIEIMTVQAFRSWKKV